MYMAKAIAAFIMSVVTGLTASDVFDVLEANQTAHLVMTILAVVCTAIVTYAVPNRGTSVVERIVP